MLFPTAFISAPEKMSVGLKNKKQNKTKKKKKKKKKKASNFWFDFTWRRVVRYSCFDFFPVKNGGIFSYLSYEILIQHIK